MPGIYYQPQATFGEAFAQSFTRAQERKEEAAQFEARMALQKALADAQISQINTAIDRTQQLLPFERRQMEAGADLAGLQKEQGELALAFERETNPLRRELLEKQLGHQDAVTGYMQAQGGLMRAQTGKTALETQILEDQYAMQKDVNAQATALLDRTTGNAPEYVSAPEDPTSIGDVARGVWNWTGGPALSALHSFLTDAPRSTTDPLWMGENPRTPHAEGHRVLQMEDVQLQAMQDQFATTRPEARTPEAAAAAYSRALRYYTMLNENPYNLPETERTARMSRALQHLEYFQKHMPAPNEHIQTLLQDLPDLDDPEEVNAWANMLDAIRKLER